MRQALVLVGGRGTRLGDLARDTPKPLMPIAGDVRFLDYLLENVARHGVQDIILLAGHLAETVVARYEGRTVRGARVRVVREPEPAGTAGALRYAGDILDDTFFMLNGDSLFDMNLLALAPALGQDDIGVLALRRVEDAARYGRVDVNDGRVTGFHEKDPTFKGPALISGGVYLLRREVIDLISTLPCSIETDIFPKLVSQGSLAGVEGHGYFIDIGLPETLGEARDDLPVRLRRGAVFFDRDNTLTRDNGYTHKLEDLEWLPGAIDSVRRANDEARLAIVVTNQAGIARGYYDEAQMDRFHTHMQDELRKHGAHIDAFYHCPYHGEGTVSAFTYADHPDRKPNAGMLRRALIEWPIDRAQSFMVGDSEADVAAAEAVGIPAYRILPGELAGAMTKGLSYKSLEAQMQPIEMLRERAARARSWLFNTALPLWWERGYDRAAKCFHERINLDGTPASEMPRRIRVQARQTVVYARAGRLGWSGPWREAVEAGVTLLLERGLQPEGGTRFLLDTDGRPKDNRRDLYDLAFVLFALAEAACVLKDRTDIVHAAEQLLAWLEANWAHPAGGFREGDITPTPPRRQNPHMHIFEALLALYKATGNIAHLNRAGAIATLFRDKFFNSAHGALPEYFDDVWTPLPGEDGRIVEPGHHLEWSWLLDRWRKMGGEDFGVEAERLRVHAETYGVDPITGVTYDEIFIEGMPRAKSSRFWPHTERIKANVARFERTRDPNAAASAAQAFDVLMTYCDTPTPGLWRDRRKPEGGFIEEAAPASSFYHAMFGMFELIRVAETT